MTNTDFRLQGYFTALATPMLAPGAPHAKPLIDMPAFEALVEGQIRAGIHGLVPCGTTGESPTISFEETAALIEATVRIADGRVPVLAGAGGNSTEEAIDLSHLAHKAGADALLHVVPYYNKPNQRGIYAHFEAILEATQGTGLPVVGYNVPGRTVADMQEETMAALARHDRFIGIKDATGNMDRMDKVRALCGDRFTALSGDDGTTLAYLRRGGNGAISVTSNIAPGLCAELFNAHMRGDHARADAIDAQLQPVHAAMFLKDEPSPAGVKHAMSLMGICNGYMRLPMVEVADGAKAIIESTIRDAGLIASTRDARRLTA